MATAITGICGLVYATVQHTYRQNANDPQIQIVEDTAAMLDAGLPMQSVVPPYKVDMAKSLAPYIIVFDNSANPAAATVQLDGQTPKAPSGVFDFVRKYGQEWFTWEPKAGVRSAVILKKYKNGFVLVGRSLREVEIRVDRLTLIVGLAWLTTLGATFIAILFLEFLAPKKKR